MVEKVVKYWAGDPLGDDLAWPQIDDPASHGFADGGRVTRAGWALRLMLGDAHKTHFRPRLLRAASVHKSRGSGFGALSEAISTSAGWGIRPGEGLHSDGRDFT